MTKAFFITLFIFLSACGKTQPVFEKLSKDGVILAFGDSLTYGTGASQDSNYPKLLSSLSYREVINAGVPGEISSDGLKRLPSLLDKHQPELLILIHGGNDMLKKIPRRQTITNFEKMLYEARQRDIKVVMLGVPKPSLLFMSSAEMYQHIAAAHEIPIDLETLPKILSTNHLKSDAIHPNADGYKLMAENIFTLLVDSGAL